MAEADWHRCREQFGSSLHRSEFLSGGKEGPPFHQSRLCRGRRYLRPKYGALARTPLLEGNRVTPLENGVTTGIANAIPVLVDSAGQLGTMSSSARFKKGIKPMNNASEAVLALKPVTFHYKSDKSDTPQFGLIAEEVAAVNPDLVVRDDNGKIYTVRYDAVNAMLLNEFLKEHKKVERQDRRIREQEAMITHLKSDLQAMAAAQQKQIEALRAGLQKVSAQLEMSKPAPQTVLNSQ